MIVDMELVRPHRLGALTELSGGHRPRRPNRELDENRLGAEGSRPQPSRGTVAECNRDANMQPHRRKQRPDGCDGVGIIMAV